MINAKFKLHKFAKLVGQIWFYSLAMLGVALVLGLDTVTSTNIIKSLLPIGAMSWFGQNFLVLYLLTPFINPIIHRLQQNYLRLFLLIGLVIWFLTPTILNLFPQLSHTTFGFKHIFSFVYFYTIGAYIKLYGESITQKTGVLVTSIGSDRLHGVLPTVGRRFPLSLSFPSVSGVLPSWQIFLHR